MHLSIVCHRKLHRGRDFGIDNDPLLACHFEKEAIKKSSRKASKRGGNLIMLAQGYLSLGTAVISEVQNPKWELPTQTSKKYTLS